MKKKEIIGIDISKSTIDFVIHSNQMHFVVKNNNSGFNAMIKKVGKFSPYASDERLYVLEHTGMYSHLLTLFFTQNNIDFVLVPGLAIKRSLGIIRGKNDKLDAKNIALYGYRLREELKPSVIPKQVLIKMKNLMGLRDRMVKQRAGYRASLKESKSIYKKKDNKVFFEAQQKIIDQLSKSIKKIEQEINSLMQSDEEIYHLFKLITSVKGVGRQTAIYLIIYTNGFTKFENFRKLASYSGIAPFQYKSGTSIRGRTKISNLANKKLKTLLDLCAKSAIQHNTEMRIYYERRIAEGKNKRSTINIIRNKLLSRIFAVVKRGTPYVDVLKFAA